MPLLPCPFCGMLPTSGHATIPMLASMVSCDNVACAIRPNAAQPTPAESIEAWNCRVIPATHFHGEKMTEAEAHAKWLEVEDPDADYPGYLAALRDIGIIKPQA